MSVKEISRRFDANLAAEIVVLKDGLGREHHLTIHVAQHEKCAACGRLLATNGQGDVDVEKVIESAKKEFEQHEATLRKHARKLGHKL